MATAPNITGADRLHSRKSGPVTRAIVAMRSEEPRRAFLMGLAVLPLATLPAASAAPSDLALSCESAVAQVVYIDTASIAESWDDDRLNAEMGIHDAAFRRAIAEPSESLRDLAAKARLALQDFDRFVPADRRDEGEQLIAVVLSEIIALVPAS